MMEYAYFWLYCLVDVVALDNSVYEKIRNINNTIECLDHEKYMYENNIETIVDPGVFKLCEDYINAAKEVRHLKVLWGQVYRFERLIEKLVPKGVAAQSRSIVADTCMATQTHLFCHLIYSTCHVTFLLLYPSFMFINGVEDD